MPSEQSQQQVKKRNRLTLSCNYCKKRKVKCDRGHPCLSCLKYNVADLCDYPEMVPEQVSSNQEKRPRKKSTTDPNFSLFSVRTKKKLPASSSAGIQTSFHVQHARTPAVSQHTSVSLSEGYSNENDDASPEVQSELEQLKSKIRQIESTMQRQHQLPHDGRKSFSTGMLSSIPPITPSPLPYVTPSRFSGYMPSADLPNANTPNDRIQLPPINWSPPRTSISDSPHSNLNYGIYKYNPDINPAFVGVNPYASEEDTINFYDHYTPIYVKESRRVNYGPFAWLSFMKIDPGLCSLWKYMVSSKLEVIRRIQQTARAKPIAFNESVFSSLTNFKPLVTPSGGGPVEVPKKEELHESETIFRQKAIDREGFNDVRLYGNVQDSCSLRDEPLGKHNGEKGTKECQGKTGEMVVTENDKGKVQRKAMNKNAISLGLTVYEEDVDQELHLIEKIKMMLPKQRVIWTLINKFFVTVYPYTPFLDEDDFKAEMAQILGPEAYLDEQLATLKIAKRLDLANVGILLIILRLTYLSLFTNRNGENENNLKSEDPSPKAQELKFLLSNPINIDIIDMAQLCLDQFDLLRKTNLVVLQCAFFMRLYHMFSPEDGDGADGGDSQIYSGMLIQMAYSMGLNREPDNWNDVCNDDKSNNVGRKIWFFLRVSDLKQGYMFGNPPSINKMHHDTKLPYYKRGNENISDIEKEKHVISTFSYFGKYYLKVSKIIDLALDIRQNVRFPELIAMVADLETCLSETYGTLSHFLIPFTKDSFEYSFIKVMKCKNYMSLKGFLLTIFFHLYLYFERKDNKDYAFFYMKKLLAICCGEIIPGLFQLIGNNCVNFGEAADLILNPTIENLIHRVSHILISVLVKLNTTIYRMKQTGNHEINLRNNFSYKMRFGKLCKLSKILERIANFCIAAMSRMSQRYYYAWRVTKAHTFIMRLVIGEEYYKFALEDKTIRFLDFTIEQIDEVILVAEHSLKKFCKSKKFTDEIYDSNFDLKHPTEKYKEFQRNAAPESHKESNQTPPNCVDMGNRSTNSSTVGSSSELEDIQFVDNAEIDQMWYQMASMKNDPKINNNSNNNNIVNAATPGPSVTVNSLFNEAQLPRSAGVHDSDFAKAPTPYTNPLSPQSMGALGAMNGDINVNVYGYPLDSFEIFNDLHFDQLMALQNNENSLNRSFME